MTLSEDWLTSLKAQRVDRVGAALDVRLDELDLPAPDRAHLRELIEGVWWSGAERGETLRVIERAIIGTAGTVTTALLALYVRGVCAAAWDLTWEHEPILAVLDAAERAWAATAPSPGSEAAVAVRALALLRGELVVESACATGHLDRIRESSERLAGELTAATAEATDLPASDLRDHLVGLLQDRAVYFHAVAAAGRAAASFLGGGPDRLDTTIDALRDAEDALGAAHAPVSELRAHRLALERLAAARTQDWLHVDDGSVVCVFPFGLRHADHRVVVDVVKAHGHTWSLGGVPLANAPTRLLLVDDMWRGDDPLSRRYEGTQIDLPDLAVPGPDGALLDARLTITLSQLGNHYVRVELPLDGAGPHALAALAWMAAPEYGNLGEVGHRLAFVDPDRPGRGWARLTDMARDVLGDLVRALRADLGAEVELSYRPGMYHVVTTVRRASVRPGGRVEEQYALEDATRLPALFGGHSLGHPVPSGVGSVAFWALYAPAAGVPVRCAALADACLLVSDNHTVLASFGSPDYMVATVGQAVEFVASLEGMFAAWQDELSSFYLGIVPHLDRLETSVRMQEPVGMAELEGVLTDLERRQVRLRQFVTSARVSLLFIGSPALVTSPVMRGLINDLLGLNRAWLQRGDFTEVAGQALSDRLTDLIEAWTRRRTGELEARNRLRIDTLLAVVAGIGISGVLAIVQAGYDVIGWGSTVLVVLVLLVAGVVGYVSYRWSSRGDRARTRSRARGGPS